MKQLPTILLMLILTMLPTACENDADDIFSLDSQSVPVLTCICEIGQPVTVHVVSSVPYTDSTLSNSIGEAVVTITLGDSVSHHRTLKEGETDVTFTNVLPHEGDQLKIQVETKSGRKMTSVATMPTLPIEPRLRTTIRGGKKIFRVAIMDDTPGLDYYQVEARRREWTQGEAHDRILDVNYSQSVFGNYTSALHTSDKSIGLFTDKIFSIGNTLEGTFSIDTAKLAAPAATVCDSATTIVRLYHHSSDYFLFLLTASAASDFVLLPVFGTTQVHSNVSGDGLGITTGIAYREVRDIAHPDHDIVEPGTESPKP